MCAYKSILYEKKGGIATITLNRPEKLNALDSGTGSIVSEVMLASKDAADDPGVKVVIIKAAGRAFSSGYDLTQVSEGKTEGLIPARAKPESEKLPLDWVEMEIEHRSNWIDAIWTNPKPFIAQVHGFCLAGGLDLAMVCDMVIASDDAAFAYPAVRYGSIAVTPIWWLMVGLHKAKEMVLTGNMVTAKEMYDLGAVNKVVPKDKLEEEVGKLANEMVKMPAAGQQLNKMAVNDFFDILGLQTALKHVNVIGGVVHTSRDEFGKKFWKIVGEKGLKAALEVRDKMFAEADTTGKELRARKLD